MDTTSTTNEHLVCEDDSARDAANPRRHPGFRFWCRPTPSDTTAVEHSVGCAAGGDCTVHPGDERCSRLHAEVAEVLDRAASAAYEGRSVEEYVGASGATAEDVARAAAEGRALRARDDRAANVRRWRDGRRSLRGARA